MQIEKRQTETYVLTKLDELDPVTVYVTNYKIGQGKLVIECFGDAWAHYWGSMGDNTLQGFVLSADNGYLLNKLLKETRQTDFEKIEEMARAKGFDIFASNDVEIALQAREMTECFGADWCMDLPQRATDEYRYLDRILNAVKAAFSDELRKAA